MGRQNLPCERLQWINAACMLDFTQPVHSPGRQPKDSDVVDLNLNGPSDPGNSSPGTSPGTSLVLAPPDPVPVVQEEQAEGMLLAEPLAKANAIAPAPRILSTAMTSDGFNFSFGTETGKTYDVEYAESLVNPKWKLLLIRLMQV